MPGVELIKKFCKGFANYDELAYKFAEFFITRVEKIHKSFVSDSHNATKLTSTHSCAIFDTSADIEYHNLVIVYKFKPTTPKEIKAIIWESGAKCSFSNPCPNLPKKVTVVKLCLEN